MSSSLAKLKKSTSMRTVPLGEARAVSSGHQAESVKHAIASYNYQPVNVDTDLALVRGEEYEILDSSGVWWMAKNAAGEIGLIPYNYVEPISVERPAQSSGARPKSMPMSMTAADNFTLKCCCPAAENCSANNPPLPIDLAQLAQMGLPWSGAREFGLGPRHPTLGTNNNEYSSSTSTSGNSSGVSDEEGHRPTKADTAIVGPGCDWWKPHVDRETAEGLLRTLGKEGAFLVRLSATEAKCYTLSLLNKSDRYMEVKHYLIKCCPNTRHFFMRPSEQFASLEKLIKHYRAHRGHLVTKLRHSPSGTAQDTSMRPTANALGAKSLARCRSLLVTKTKAVDRFGYPVTKDKSWEIKASELQLLEELGSGQFGVVRHGKWNGRLDVAVKLMKDGTMSEADFIAEASVMTQLQHDNLVKLYGLCIEHRPIFIVAEFMKHGSLLSFLRKNESRLTESSHRVHILLNMCHQVASGMAYLEQHNYIHRDLAARNCLVGTSGVVKVADFGLTRYVIDDEYTSSGGTKFPIRWAPPEVLWFTRFSSKSDVWAYGILMWEVFTCGKLPYGKLSNAEVVEKIRAGHRLDKPKTTPPEVYSLMKTIWQEVPEKRPSFARVESYLVALKCGESAKKHRQS